MKKTMMGLALLASFSAAPMAGFAQTTSEEAKTLPTVQVYKSPTCGCCSKWEDHMREHGFKIESTKTNDMAEVKAGLGVPASSASCHTAMVGDYFVEGHVPAKIVKTMLQANPSIRGISAPGMPSGSPGMEMPGHPGEPYDIHVIGLNGGASVLTTVQP
jgi:hypothetical protein